MAAMALAAALPKENLLVVMKEMLDYSKDRALTPHQIHSLLSDAHLALQLS